LHKQHVLKTYHTIDSFVSEKKTVLTLGTFDGVHKGHQAILQKLKKASQEMDCESLVLTFFPHPRMVLHQDSEIKLLNTIEERIELLERYGLDNLIVHPFDEKFSNLSAEAFVAEILVKRCNVAKVIIGYDHRFGKNRSATLEDLIAFGAKYDFQVEQITAQEINEVSVSSTKIRHALEAGEVVRAQEYLGYPYFFTAQVVEGKKLGRTIGFPTANLLVNQQYKLIPQEGVYAVSASFEGTILYGMMNIGYNPTVNGQTKTIEVNFFNFDANLYHATLRINIHERLRAEQQFASLDMLKAQLQRDKQFSEEFFAKRKHEI